MKRALHALAIPFLVLGLAACGNSKESAEAEPAYVLAAKERFGESFACEPNAAEDYVLCAHRPGTSAMEPIPKVAFFVYGVEDDEVVLEEPQTSGNVVWTGDYEIELTLVPGIVTSDGRGAPKYRIDVRSGDRSRLDGAQGIPK